MNPGLLKLELMAHGIRAAEGLPEVLANPFGLVHLVLPEGLVVSTHQVIDHADTPFTLRRAGERFILEDKRTPEAATLVRWTPPLQSYQQKTSSGVAVADILTVHSGFIAAHPRGRCRFGQSGLACRYCGSTRELSDHPPFSKQDLVEALEIVLKEKRCDFVHLSSGHVETEDGGLVWLEPWVTEIRRHINILISLNLAPPRSDDWIDRTYAVGVDAVYYDPDLFNPNEAERRRHLEALTYAAKIFPTGAVLSHLAIGLEPLEKTRSAIDALIGRGVVPILVFFPPYPESDLARRWTIKVEEITGLYAHLFEELVKTKNTPHWVQQLDVVLSPLEGRFFSTRSPGYHLVLKNFYQTAFGRRVRMGVASLRRRLRVQHQPVRMARHHER